MSQIEKDAEIIRKRAGNLGCLMMLDDQGWEAVRRQYKAYSPFFVPMDVVPLLGEIVRFAAERPKRGIRAPKGPNMSEVSLFLKAATIYGIVRFKWDNRIEIMHFLEREIGEPFVRPKDFYADFLKRECQLSRFKAERVDYYMDLLEEIGIKPRMEDDILSYLLREYKAEDDGLIPLDF